MLCLNNLGNIYYWASKNNNASKYYVDALKLAEKHGF